MARPVLQVLEGGIPACAAEADPGWLGFGRKVRALCTGADALALVILHSSPVNLLRISTIFIAIVPPARLQREEEAAYAISHGSQAQAQAQAAASQTHPALPSLGPFSKFEEKKTNEKTRKVTTVKKFFSTSSSRTSKKGMTIDSAQTPAVLEPSHENKPKETEGLFRRLTATSNPVLKTITAGGW